MFGISNNIFCGNFTVNFCFLTLLFFGWHENCIISFLTILIYKCRHDYTEKRMWRHLTFFYYKNMKKHPKINYQLVLTKVQI